MTGGDGQAERHFSVLVCQGPTCGDRRGGGALADALTAAVAERGIGDRVRIQRETCFGHCLRGPNVLVCDDELLRLAGGIPWGGSAGAVLYNRVGLKNIPQIVERHLIAGAIVTPLLNRPPVRDP